MIPAQRKELAADEGTRLTVYDDGTGLPILPGDKVIGHPTVGVGRCLDTHGITADEAQFLFENDIAGVEFELVKLHWWQRLDPVRQGVCCNLAFNMGVTGLLGFRHMIAAMERSDFEAAAMEMQRSKWAQQVQATRRDRLVAQMRSGTIGPVA